MKQTKIISPPSTFAKLRTYFLTGLVICAPLAITIYLTWNITIWIDSWVIPYIPDIFNLDKYLPVHVPGFGVVIVLFAITLIGFLTANLIGRSIVNVGENILARMPVVRNIYSALKQIFETAFQENARHFNTVVLVEYPRKGIWALAFVTTNTLGEVRSRIKKKAGESLSVFIPTTPNPTSGFLLFVPKKDVIVLDMSVEEAAKLVISAGLVVPDVKGKKKKNQPARNRRTASSRENK